jgi:hypothetical protein
LTAFFAIAKNEQDVDQHSMETDGEAEEGDLRQQGVSVLIATPEPEFHRAKLD